MTTTTTAGETLSVAEPGTVVGWREWVALPDLGIMAVKVKVDTGAKTSALHAFDIRSFTRAATQWVRFGLHPLSRREDIVIHCEAPVIDRRRVSDSGGHREERYVIATEIQLGGCRWPIEITLTNREDMQFRMLLGRTALVTAGLLVDPSRSYQTGRRLRHLAHYTRISTPTEDHYENSNPVEKP